MDISINDWNDITAHLNGYVLDRIIIDENRNVYGINSSGQHTLLARPAGAYWQGVDGKAFMVVETLLDEVKAIVKASGNYEMEYKKEVLKNTFERAIKLYNKNYNKA